MAEKIIAESGSGKDVRRKLTHEITLQGEGQKVGLRLVHELKDVDQHSLQPENVKLGEGGGQWGPFGPTQSQLEQDTWHGGRGVERFADNPAGFYDSMMAFTLISGQVTAAPQFNLAEGLRDEDRYLPEPYNVDWKALRGDYQYIDILFTAGQNYDADKAYMWLRRVGEPESVVTLALCSDDGGGDPDAVLKSATVDLDTITDEISIFQVFDWASTQALVNGTDYHLRISSDGNDDDKNYWEIGVDTATSGAQISSTGAAASWSSPSSGFKPYYRVVDADVNRYFIQFEFRGAWYAVDVRLDGSASHLYLQGDRGKATGGTATTLQDTNKTFVADRYIGAMVGIVAGTGKGQWREITDNDTNTLTFGAMDITPDATSVYVIIGTRYFQDISPGSGDQFDAAVTSVVVMKDQVYFARGTAGSYPILRMRFNEGASPPAHQFDDDPGSNKADVLAKFDDPTKGPLVWRVENDDVVGSSSKPPNWGSNLNFSSDENIGDPHYPVKKLIDFEKSLWAIKTDGLYYEIAGSNRWIRDKSNLDGVMDENNGQAAAVHNVFLYYSYGGFSMIRQISQDKTDVGPWQRAGLPEERKGGVSSLQPMPNYLAVGIDAGDSGISSVMLFENGGYHEMLRGWETGARVRGLARQSIGDGIMWLWTSMGSDLVFQILPEKGYNPVQDSNYRHCHEFVLDTTAYDMKVMSLKKLFKRLYVSAENLGDGQEIVVYYQLDGDVGTGNWTKLQSSLRTSPMSEISIGRGEKRQVRIRLRCLTNRANTGIRLLATVLTGWTRLPDEDVWQVRARLGEKNKQGGDDRSADETFNLLREFSEAAMELEMESIWPWMDQRRVSILTPKPLFGFWDRFKNRWSGDVLLTIIGAR
jgi:hypothetical protein